MHWLQIDVSRMAGVPGATHPVSGSGSMEGLGTPLGWVREEDPVSVSLTLQNAPDGVEATGLITGRWQLSCSRCLVEFAQDFEVDVDEMFYRDRKIAEAKEAYEVVDETVDLEPMLRDLIVLGIPITPVHDEGCKGLCPECGADLNVTQCRHGRRATDARWAPLQALVASQSPGDEKEVEN